MLRVVVEICPHVTKVGAPDTLNQWGKKIKDSQEPRPNGFHAVSGESLGIT